MVSKKVENESRSPGRRIVVTIGAYPDVGKGIFTSSLGYCFQELGYKVFPVKFDGYLNTSSGGMNPYHGSIESKYSEEEVFVLSDGYEADVDSGYYERFLDAEFPNTSTITNGSLFSHVLYLESQKQLRQGEVINYRYVRNHLINNILDLASTTDILMLEIGGTIGDKESEMMFDAINLIKSRKQAEVYTIMLSPYFPKQGEEGLELSFRSKVTRQAYEKSWRLGVAPDAIVLRTSEGDDLRKNDLEYIALETGLDDSQDVYIDPTCFSIYQLPQIIKQQSMDKRVLHKLGLQARTDSQTNRLLHYVDSLKRLSQQNVKINLGIFGKTVSYDSYVSLKEAIQHAAVALDSSVEISWLDESKDFKADLKNQDALIIAEGLRQADEKLFVLEFARKNKIPCLAISFGMDLMIKDYLKNEEKVDITIEEIEKPEKMVIRKGNLKRGSINLKTAAHSKYKKLQCNERMRCFSEISAELLERLSTTQLEVTAFEVETKQPMIIELSDHPFFVGVRFHPEFLSHPGKPHPLFSALLQSAIHEPRIDDLSHFYREKMQKPLRTPVQKQKLFIGSTNKGKIADYKLFFESLDVISCYDLGIHQDVHEGISSLQENSAKKAREWAKASNLLTIADDTGFFIPALGGKPGVSVKRWGGELGKELTDREFITYLQAKLAEVDDTTCYFETSYSLARPTGEVYSFSIKHWGKIDKSLFDEAYIKGYPLSAVFKADGSSTTWAEMSDEEKITSEKEMIDQVLRVLPIMENEKYQGNYLEPVAKEVVSDYLKPL